jgi:hypothetical protein
LFFLFFAVGVGHIAHLWYAWYVVAGVARRWLGQSVLELFRSFFTRTHTAPTPNSTCCSAPTLTLRLQSLPAWGGCLLQNGQTGKNGKTWQEMVKKWLKNGLFGKQKFRGFAE